MPTLAIESILKVTTEDILVGYIDSNDIDSLPRNSRIAYIDLSEFQVIEGLEEFKGYVDFSKDIFYKLVQYKWVLLKYAASLNPEIVVFSDFDVYWNLSPLKQIQQTFENRPEINIQIQTYTSSPAREELCMGFVAFRRNRIFTQIIEDLSQLHRVALNNNPRTGDDNVISDLYNADQEFRASVMTLPQSTFPTGNLINTYGSRDLFPGLKPYAPFVFHANFVVGNFKKINLLKTFIYNSQFGENQLRRRIQNKIFLWILRSGVFLKNILR